MDPRGHRMGVEQGRGDGLQGTKGLIEERPHPALNVQGQGQVLSCSIVAATLPGSMEQCKVWTSEVPQPSPPAPLSPFTHHRLSIVGP